MRCVRSAATRAAYRPLVGILNFGSSIFDSREIIAECQCYVIVSDVINTPLEHNVACGIQVMRCAMPIPQNITVQFVP
jgi:hypothetical protein